MWESLFTMLISSTFIITSGQDAIVLTSIKCALELEYHGENKKSQCRTL